MYLFIREFVCTLVASLTVNGKMFHLGSANHFNELLNPRSELDRTVGTLGTYYFPLVSEEGAGL